MLTNDQNPSIYDNLYWVSSNNELRHYGVLGMKWGVHRANRKTAKNVRLERKALKYDKESANLTKKAEEQHAKQDLGRSNRAAVKAAKYDRRAAKIRKKALGKDDIAQVTAEKKAAKLEYKAVKNRANANRLSKTTGYGASAMGYAIMSDKVAIKAARARSKMASNKAYISMMDKRLDSLDADTLRKVEMSMTDYLLRRNA